MAKGENKVIQKLPTGAEKAGKTKRINAEKKRLMESFKDLPEDNLNVALGLIEEAAYMRVTLDDWKKELDATGWTELFSQSEKTNPYEKKRAKAEMYLNMNPNYQRIIKQLTDLLPKDVEPNDVDELEQFNSSRRDV